MKEDEILILFCFKFSLFWSQIFFFEGVSFWVITIKKMQKFIEGIMFNYYLLLLATTITTT